VPKLHFRTKYRQLDKLNTLDAMNSLCDETG